MKYDSANGLEMLILGNPLMDLKFFSWSITRNAMWTIREITVTKTSPQEKVDIWPRH